MAPNKKHLRTAEPKPPPDMTEEQRQRHNDLAALRRFTRLVNTNFHPQSFYATLTLDDEHLVDNFMEARRILDNYIRRLQYACPDVVAVAVMGWGITTDRIHFHMIIKGVNQDTIMGKWNAGSIKRIENLREHNIYNGVDHGQDYTGLARYLFMHWTPEQGGKRWKQTKNIRQPDKEKPQLAKRHYSEVKTPKAPKGYKLVEKRSTEYGYLYFKYVRIPNPPKGPMKC